MKKFKIGISFIVLVVLCLIFQKFILMINYISALVLHEMSHLIVAVSRGYKLKLIKLDVFGMSIDLDNSIDDKDCFAINIAGPICNILISVCCMALYWLIPQSYNILNVFCVANLSLALFNLLPVYPLDGGKIFRGLIREDKHYKRLDFIVRLIISVICLCIFIVSINHQINWFCLLMALFFATSKPQKETHLSVLKNPKSKAQDKVIIYKINPTETLVSLLKKLKYYHYTIYYVPQLELFIDEDKLVDLATKYSLTSTISQVKEFSSTR